MNTHSYAGFFSYYDRMAEILNGFLFLNLIGGTLLLADSILQIVSVRISIVS